MSSLYSTEESRVKSFRTWPHLTSKTATPPKLAQAGFFHNPTAENPDRCTCFLCGTSLVSWDVTDIPLEEHRKHARHCDFLQQLLRYNHTTISMCADDADEDQESPFTCATRSIIADMQESSSKHSGPGSEGGRGVANLVTQLRSGVVQSLLFGQIFEATDGDWDCRDIPLP